jgi:glutamate-1-semialdehyde 2,1-aminomutase
MILGHAHPRVREAIAAALDGGTSFGAPTERENQLAEQIIQAVPSIEMVRLVNSGTEAVTSALRLARGYTNRAKIVKFTGGYHGHVDCLLVASGSAGATLGVPDSPGIPASVASDTMIATFNRADEVEEIFAAIGDQIAAVIVEPAAGNMGCVPPDGGFLERLRAVTQQHGALLIFDEIITGFRLAFGGAQARYGVTPDLTTLGKILGGGMPLGAYGGRREIMNHVLPAGKVFQAGTLSGNPLATSAGLATMQLLQESPPYDRLERRADRLADGLVRACRNAGIPAWVQRAGSMLTLFFHPGPIKDWQQARRSDTSRYARFFWGMIDRGIYLPCSQFECWFVSDSHTEDDIEFAIDSAWRVLKATGSSAAARGTSN